MAKGLWIDRTFQPPAPYVALVKSEAELRAALRDMKHERHLAWTDTPGKTWPFTNAQGSLVCIVAIDASKEPDLTRHEINGLIVHEAVHVWQFWCDEIGETQPGAEQEAYAVQFIAGKLMTAYWGDS